jgi:hypothetical protein
LTLPDREDRVDESETALYLLVYGRAPCQVTRILLKYKWGVFRWKACFTVKRVAKRANNPTEEVVAN